MSTESNTFEVRLRNDSKIFSRHYKAKDSEKAAQRALVKNKGSRVVFSRKVHSSDVIGTIGSMNLQDIIGVERRRPDVILDNTTLDSLVFPGRNKGKKKNNSNRRFRNEDK